MILSTTKVFFLGALLALAQGQKAEDDCKSKCSLNNQEDKEGLDACLKGCQNFKNAEHYDELIGEDSNETLALCKHSCDDDTNTVDKEPCYQGCRNNGGGGVKREMSRPKSLLDFMFGDDIFKGLEGNDGHRHGGLSISLGLPRFVVDGDFTSMHEHMGDMMRQMNQQMNRVFSSLRGGMSPLEGHSGGKMYIMQSGPGYHEEKTYDIGPNGQMTLIKNDMMDQENPLEKSMKDTDVEIFNPKAGEDQVLNEIDKAFESIIQKEQQETMEEDRLIQPILQELNRKIAEQHYNGPRLPEHGLRDGPRLPEHGLRSRDLCRADSPNMKWSEWVNCLHIKMGIPRWVMTTSICMGIIFLLWLCLVIPSNAPKQRVKSQQSPIIPVIHPKEVEASRVISEKIPKYPKDLPPAYEDVANMTVTLEPVHGEKEEKKPVA